MMSASLRGRRRSIANFRNTDRVRLSSLVRRTALTDQRNWAALGVFVALTRARGAPRLTRSIWLSRLGGAAAISF